MEKHTKIELYEKLSEFCKKFGYVDQNIMIEITKRVNEYLEIENSSIDTAYSCIEKGIKYNAWILSWNGLEKEKQKILQKERSKEEKERKILEDYKEIDLGSRFLSIEELKKIRIFLGIIDKYGIYHTLERKDIPKIDYPDHRKLAEYLKEKRKILDYYIRVGTICGKNEGILCAESIYYDDKNKLRDFLLNEKMAIALYNSLMSRKSTKYNTFEERLAYYTDEFGYYSIKYRSYPRIFDRNMFEKNMKVLERTLDGKFDKKYFKSILENN